MIVRALWNWLRRPRPSGMWDHLSPDDLRRIPAGLCDCDALSWSSASPRPDAPETGAKWREVRELRALFDLPERKDRD